jgi:Flp pilus assembly protein TadG
MSRMFANRRRSSRPRRGAAAVEAALTMPILIIITFGSIDVTQYMNLAQQVTNASREGARLVSRATTDSVEDVENAVLDYMANSMPTVPRD